MEIHLPIKNGFRNSTSNSHRENLKKETQEKKRNILHLILKYLMDCNLMSAAEALQNEAQIGSQYQVCENIDLEIIVEEYQSYFYTKFQKQPKILRKIDENVQPINKKASSNIKDKSNGINNKNIKPPEELVTNNFKFEIMSLSSSESQIQIKPHEIKHKPEKSLCDYEDYSPEWREMADQIIKQIIPKNLGVSFEDCIGLNDTVETLKEAIIYPLQYPHLFKNTDPWKGILLYGPPGTGKTLLAKALACQTPTTVINVTSSAFISKWRGESEKMLKVLFDVAKLYAPTTIFIDEIDALACSNHDTNHEASRRFKSELLVQIDGILKHQNQEVFVLASTNNPWCLSQALLRRFEKRLLVPLPCKGARKLLFEYYLNRHLLTEDLTKIVDATENFSGSDIRNICKEAEMIIIREKLRELKTKNGTKDNKNISLRNAEIKDIFEALKKIRPCLVNAQYGKYIDWGSNYGAS